MTKPSPDPRMSIHNLMAYYLRFLRLKHKLTQAPVAELLECSVSQVSKYETGAKHLDTRQCARLDHAWDTGGLFSILLYYAQQGTDASWPERLLRYQRTSTALRIFSATVVPLPFQTQDYARGLLEAGWAARQVRDVDAALARRMRLQEDMLDDDPEIWAILDEVALRPMGPDHVMKEQLRHLHDFANHNHVSIRIMPLNATPHIGVDGSFWCFDLPNGLRAAFAGTAIDLGGVLDDQTLVANVLLRFERIAARAWNEDQSLEHIARMCER